MMAAAAQYEKENNDMEVAKPKAKPTEVPSSEVSGGGSILGSLEKMVESR